MTYVNQNSSDSIIRAALKVAGARAGNRTTRPNLIILAKQAGIWAPVTKSIVPATFKAKYGKLASNGDDVAANLKQADINAVAKANSVDMDRWGNLNPGQQRMNLGNVLRGRIRRGEYVQIGLAEYNEIKAA